MRKIFFIFSLLCLVSGLAAQVTISGKVTDQAGKPLSFVSVTLKHGGKRFLSTATHESGKFDLVLSKDTLTHFTIDLSLIGYVAITKPFTYPDTSFLSNIILVSSETSLGNVTVTSNKPLVTRKADRYIINVENSFLANGNSALDVLQRSPGLWVDNNGSIRIRGNQSVTVMVNDVVQRMSGDELAEYLRTLRSEDISKIEIIPNPPAEYEAAGAGGIVHIVLKKAKKDGLTGSVSTQYRQQGKDPLYGFGGSGDYKSGDLYMTGGFSYTKDINNSYGNTQNRFADGGYFKSIGTRHNDNDRKQYRFNLSYELSKTQSIIVQTQYSGTAMRHGFFNDISQYSGGKNSTGTNTTDWIRNLFQTSTNVLYQIKTDTLGSVFKLKAEYTHGTREEINTFTGTYSDPLQNQVLISNTPSETNIVAVQADHLEVYKNTWQFRTGIKYAGVERNNLVGIYPFNYQENLLMGYAAIEKTIQQTSIKLGLRTEQTWSKGSSTIAGTNFSKSYIGLFPTLFISHVLDKEKGAALSFSYAKRLQRPGFNELNPYRVQLNTVVSIKGNPSLRPQYTHNFDLSWQMNNGWSLTGFLSLTTDIITQLTTPVGNQSEVQFMNLDKNNGYGLNMELPIRITKKWTTNNSLSLYHSNYTTNTFNNSRTTFAVNHSESFAWPSFVDIDIQASYRSPYVNANNRVADNCYSDIYFSRRIMKGKARLRLIITDIFNMTREAEQTDYLGAYSEFYQKRQTQNFGLSFNYNFSIGKKFNTKKIEQTLSDEKGRLGN
jgi:outer membrane receptor protein involved in Fe transport